MIGAKYLRYFPKEVFQLVSGLTIYKSVFKNPDGSDGVVGGTHSTIKLIESQFHGQDLNHFISNQFKVFKMGYQINPDIGLLGFKSRVNEDEAGSGYESDSDDENTPSLCPLCYHVHAVSVQQKLKQFQEAEDVGIEIQYRCVNCRNCMDCKDQAHSTLSVREEVEQHAIIKTVTVLPEERQTVASLPLIGDPAIKLTPNEHIARKAYDRVVAKLSKNEERRRAAIKSEAKLQDLGFVDYVKNLSPDIQKELAESGVQNYIPWNVVFKEDSLSTPCRIVFNASMPTDTGYSLNNILAKGQKTLNKLLEIFLRWRTHPAAYHSDVQKMYNAVKLLPRYWAYQRYLFHPTLDPKEEPEQKVAKTIMYGVKSSGNQAETALRLTSDLYKNEYPEVNAVVREDTYMDDTMSGEATIELADQRCDELEVVLNHTGFSLKGFTTSTRDPDPALSSDGVSINVAGHRWFPKEDLISLDSKEVNFAPKHRGKYSGIINEAPKRISRKTCASKVGEIFDFSGMLVPITAAWKDDLRTIRKIDWKDAIPDNLRPLWDDTFKLMGEIKQLKYRRAVVPHDAVSLEMTTLEFGDASKILICVAIYVRFLRKCGKYSCQLLLAKSRLVPQDMTQPRAEFFAAVSNTHCGEVVKRALKKNHKKAKKFTDSQIALNWISNDSGRVKDEWVRNRHIEINRFTAPDQWVYVASEDMIADKGTRRCTSLSEVDSNSDWINGYAWMAEEEDQFPSMT